LVVPARVTGTGGNVKVKYSETKSLNIAWAGQVSLITMNWSTSMLSSKGFKTSTDTAIDTQQT